MDRRQATARRQVSKAASAIEYTRPAMYPKQAAAIFGPARYAVIEASTKSGKTHGCLAWLFEQAVLGEPGRNYWWVAPVASQARMAYRRLRRGLPRRLFRSSETELCLRLANGAAIWFKGADHPDSLYGEDVWAAVIDEASRCKEEAWHAVRSTLTATRGPVRIIGNVKGRRNWAYRLARKAESGASGMAYSRITAVDAAEAGVLSFDEIEDARANLPETVFRELYLAEASDDGGNPFGLAAIAACVGSISGAEPAWWGWDLAKSDDWTVGVALDEDGAVCRLERWQAPWETTLRQIRAHVGGVAAFVDSTGVGDPVVELLQRGGGNFEGFKFTSLSKQQLMERLAVAIQSRSVQIPDGILRLELESFEFSYGRSGVRYSAPAGLHDDCVCALALAVALRGSGVRRFEVY